MIMFLIILMDSRNIEYLQKYKKVTTDINMQIITTRSKFDSFDKKIESIYSCLIKNIDSHNIFITFKDLLAQSFRL